MLGDKTVGVYGVLHQRRVYESMVDAHLGCSTKVAKDVTTDDSSSDKFVYECLGEVR